MSRHKATKRQRRAMKWLSILMLAIVIALSILAALPFSAGRADDKGSLQSSSMANPS
jgi:hypothetical protein